MPVDSSVFRKEVLANRFKRTEAVSVHKFPLLPLLSLSLFIIWALFCYVLITREHVQKNRFMGIVTPANSKLIDAVETPNATMIGLVIIPESSVKEMDVGYQVEIEILDEAFSSVPPIKSSIVSFADTSRTSGAINNAMAIVIFDETVYWGNGEFVTLESGKFFHASIRSRSMGLLQFMLKPMETLFAATN